jgi:enoyl-CoA hydratase
VARIEEQDDFLIYEKDPEKKIAWLTLNRPEKLNACKIADYPKIAQIVKDVETDDDVKVLVFRGRGRSFCAGHDVSEIANYYGFGEAKEDRRPSQRERLVVDRNIIFGLGGVYQTILRCLKATICQAHGHCYGSGVLIALNADITIASPDAKFIHPGWRYVGPSVDTLIPLWFATIGVKRAKEMMLTGKPLTADEALQYGLVNKVVPLDDLEQTVNTYAEAIAQMPMDGIVMGKAALEEAHDQMGVGLGSVSGAMMHAWSTNLRFERGEFNLLKTRRDEGVKAAIRKRDEKYRELIGE